MIIAFSLTSAEKHFLKNKIANKFALYFSNFSFSFTLVFDSTSILSKLLEKL